MNIFMKKQIIYSLLLLSSIVWGACVDDKGNYDYADADDIFPVRITGLNDEETVSQGAVLRITPTVENDDPSRYTYRWSVTNIIKGGGGLPVKTYIAETKNLEYLVNLNVDDYTLRFEVRDEKRELFCRKDITLKISAAPVAAGWYVLKNDGDEADFDFINADGTQYDNLLWPMGNRPKGTALNMAYQNSRYSHVEYDSEGTATQLNGQTVFYITTDQDIRTYNAKTLKLFKTFNDQFYTAPTTIKPQKVAHLRSGSSFLMNDGKIYSIYGMSMNIGKFSAEKVGLHSLYPDFVTYMGFNTILVFDESNRTFYTANDSGNSLTALGNVPLTESKESISLADMDYSVTRMGSNTDELSGYSYLLMRNDKNNSNNLLRVSADGQFISFKPVPDNNPLLQASVIAPSFSSDFLYFVLPGDNKVYSYENATGLEKREKVIITYGAEEENNKETVVDVHHCFNNKGYGILTNSLSVLTQTANGWKLYQYDLIGESNPEINPEPTAIYSGTGIGRYILFRMN